MTIIDPFTFHQGGPVDSSVIAYTRGCEYILPTNAVLSGSRSVIINVNLELRLTSKQKKKYPDYYLDTRGKDAVSILKNASIGCYEGNSCMECNKERLKPIIMEEHMEQMSENILRSMKAMTFEREYQNKPMSMGFIHEDVEKMGIIIKDDEVDYDDDSKD